MKHAREDYDVIQDNSDARALAEHILSMSFVSAKGQHARHLARKVLGIADPNHVGEDIAISTNGTTRFIPADEPVFLIRGQDIVGGDAVRAWASLAEAAGSSFDICQMARAHAAKMDAWPKKKVADVPRVKVRRDRG